MNLPFEQKNLTSTNSITPLSRQWLIRKLTYRKSRLKVYKIEQDRWG
jgi:hypothetical protein